MAVLLSEAPELLAVEALPHKTWTRDELALVEATGVFEGTHFELIEGELIDKMGKKFPHVAGTRELALALSALFAPDHVLQEPSIDISDADNPKNEPEPDVVVLNRTFRGLGNNAKPKDIVLVAEVADTTLHQDLTTKARLYARAAIAEYWVLDLPKHRIHVYRDPSGDAYQTRFIVDEAGSVAPLAQPDRAIAVSSVLP